MKHIERKKATIALSYAAYADNLEVEIDRAHDKIIDTLLKLRPYIGKYDIIWGPAIYKTKYEIFCDSLVFIAQCKEDPSEYFIAIRGTDPVSLDTFIYENYDVFEQVWWDYGSAPLQAKISKAMYTALHDLLQAESYNKYRNCKTGMVDFLTDIINHNKKKVDITITGHSLGGGVSSTLALWLHDKIPFLWPEKPFDLHVFSYAGPTAGNEAFAAYSDRIIGNVCHRFVNPLDMAPKLWNKNDILSLFKLYKPIASIDPISLFVLKLISFLLKNKGYTQIKTMEPVESELKASLDSYWFQMIYQHIEPYLDEFVSLVEKDMEVTDKETFKKSLMTLFGFKEFGEKTPSKLHIFMYGLKMFWSAFKTTCKTIVQRIFGIHK